ncbi:putative PLP-binding barrel [Heracleum sosnowskyi]|uniref:PLP-binding barrel n=1 Tax=Heracleum sosnowskyi TaxID=360622 RepID=A0AAD8MYJ3_9APIA|nr:putative PLP-binding barrel [Heracleum sosnowskyi]
MLHCLRPTPLAATRHLHPLSPRFQGTSDDGTPESSDQPSPTVNLSNAYKSAVQTTSYGEIRSKLYPDNSDLHEVQSQHLDGQEEEHILEEVLNPNRECVQEALESAKNSTLTRLISSYFEQSEHTSRFCLLLHHSLQRARSSYVPLHKLIAVLPLDSESEFLNQLQCDQAFKVFHDFDRLENPFPHPDSENFSEMRECFSQLKRQLDSCLLKSRSRIRHVRRATVGCAICLIGTVVGVTLTAVAIATHALVALVACPVCSTFLPSNITKKELAHMALLDAAAKNTYVLLNDLDTIDRLVARLHTEIEGDKLLIRLGLERGSDRHAIQEVAKQLYKNHLNFLRQLSDLEEHLCLCFAAINRARALLLQEIHLHQIHLS